MMESARRMENVAPPHTLIVSGTSSGKTTLLYLVAAKERGVVTVVVAPTVALEQEIVSNGKRYAEGGVIVCDWKDKLADDRDSWENVEGLVVVQVESALTERFQDFLTVLNAKSARGHRSPPCAVLGLDISLASHAPL
jgi:superfamily II DNA helicase RecQ